MSRGVWRDGADRAAARRTKVSSSGPARQLAVSTKRSFRGVPYRAVPSVGPSSVHSPASHVDALQRHESQVLVIPRALRVLSIHRSGVRAPEGPPMKCLILQRFSRGTALRVGSPSQQRPSGAATVPPFRTSSGCGRRVETGYARTRCRPASANKAVTPSSQALGSGTRASRNPQQSPDGSSPKRNEAARSPGLLQAKPPRRMRVSGASMPSFHLITYPLGTPAP